MLGLIVVIGFGLLCLFQTSEVYAFRGIFTGRNPYHIVAIEGCFWLHRLITFSMSAVMGLCMLAITPRSEIPVLSTWGTRTLQVYLLHFPIITALNTFGVISWLLALPHG